MLTRKALLALIAMCDECVRAARDVGRIARMGPLDLEGIETCRMKYQRALNRLDALGLDAAPADELLAEEV